MRTRAPPARQKLHQAVCYSCIRSASAAVEKATSTHSSSQLAGGEHCHRTDCCRRAAAERSAGAVIRGSDDAPGRARGRVLPRQRPAPHAPRAHTSRDGARRNKPAFADDEAEVKPARRIRPGHGRGAGHLKIEGETISESILGTITSSVRARSARPRRSRSTSLGT